ncbi:MAG: alpha/beta hydrolase [Chloroflexi bacterium]|nr:alpha/beta hydrolase [Chloroflexota bacterium]
MDRLPVVLLPGMMLDARLYAGQIGALSPVAEVSCPDFGPGQSIGAMAEHVLARAPRRFALVGLSMGGIVGLEIWRRDPDRVTHLALLDTTPFADAHSRRAVRLEQIAHVESGGLVDVLKSLKSRYLAKRHRQDFAILRSIAEQGVALGVDAFRRQSLALRDRHDNTAALPCITCPALVLCGREDELCDDKPY